MHTVRIRTLTTPQPAIPSEQPSDKAIIKPPSLLLLLHRLPLQKFILLRIDNILPRKEVRHRELDPLATSPKFISENHDQIERNAKVSSDEVLVIKNLVLPLGIMHKDVEILEDGHHDAEYERKVRPIQPKGCSVRHHILAHPLRAPSAHEPDVRYKNRNPGQQAEDGDQIDKIREDFFGVVGYVQEGYASYQGAEGEGVDGQPALVRAREDAVRVPLLGEAVECSCRDVQVAVCG